MDSCTYIHDSIDKAYMSVVILVFDSARKGSHKLLIRTVDTDILVLEIAYAERLGVQKLWTVVHTFMTVLIKLI